MRNADGSLAYIVTRNGNLGELDTRGVDVSAHWRQPLAAGRVTLSFNGSYTARYQFQRERGSEFVQNAGRFVDGGAVPRWKHHLGVSYSTGAWTVGPHQRYTQGYLDENLVAPEFVHRVAAYSVWDLFGTWSPSASGTGWTVSAGLRNLLDPDPPYSNQGRTFQVGYDLRLTDPTGRALYAVVNYKFK